MWIRIWLSVLKPTGSGKRRRRQDAQYPGPECTRNLTRKTLVAGHYEHLPALRYLLQNRVCPRPTVGVPRHEELVEKQRYRLAAFVKVIGKRKPQREIHLIPRSLTYGGFQRSRDRSAGSRHGYLARAVSDVDPDVTTIGDSAEVSIGAGKDVGLMAFPKTLVREPHDTFEQPKPIMVPQQLGYLDTQNIEVARNAVHGSVRFQSGEILPDTLGSVRQSLDFGLDTFDLCLQLVGIFGAVPRIWMVMHIARRRRLLRRKLLLELDGARASRPRLLQRGEATTQNAAAGLQ